MVVNSILKEYLTRFKFPEKQEFKEFFTSLSDYKSDLPYIPEVERFCIRLYEARVKNEKICIYSDYDTDAVTATATMFWGLKYLGFLQENLDFYVPDRFVEGYGMNTEAVEMLAQKFDLIISVDCGINSTKEAEIVKKSNCDLIITDHHHLHGEIPDCMAVINPRLANFYKQNSGIYTQRQKNNFTEFTDWQKSLKNYIQTDKNTLSESATGVAVSWFCLVWFGYFLLDNNL